MENSEHDRRQFLKKLGVASAGVLMSGRLRADETAKNPENFQVPRRKFGRHDFTVSSLALGGHALRMASDEEAPKIVDAALAHGVNFFDNCWEYFDGKAEELMGKLIEGKRDKIFLMTKVCSNHMNLGKARAMQMLEDSLRRLRTDHLDLWQLHALESMAQVDLAYSPGGTLEALTEAQKQGKVRFIGFTGHSDPDVHLAMITRGFPFDSVQMPINPLDALHGKGFHDKVLPEAVKRGIAPLAMKTMGGGKGPLVNEGKITAAEALGYALSSPVTAVVSGITKVSDVQENAKIAATFTKMNKDRISELEGRFSGATAFAHSVDYAHPAYRDGHGRMA